MESLYSGGLLSECGFNGGGFKVDDDSGTIYALNYPFLFPTYVRFIVRNYTRISTYSRTIHFLFVMDNGWSGLKGNMGGN